MLIEINTGNTVQGDEKLSDYVKDVIKSELSNFTDQITRVEVNLSDENGSKGGLSDKRCAIEVRMANRKPTAVTCNAETLDLAISGAAEKLRNSVASTLERLRNY